MAIVSSAAAFITTREETNELLDLHMKQIATFIRPTSLTRTGPIRSVPPHGLNMNLEDAYLVSIRGDNGALIFASGPEAERMRPSGPDCDAMRLGGIDYRVYSLPMADRRIVVAQQLEPRQEAAATAVLTALLPVVVLVPISGLVISYVIRRQLAPLDAVAQAVAARPPFALDPLPVTGLPVEVVPLTIEITRLLGRRQTANEQEQRFLADAAHALRTPLTALPLQADILDGTRDDATRVARLAELRAGIRRAVRLANHLLVLARNDNLQAATPSQTDLDSAIASTWAVYRPIAAVRNIALEVGVTSNVNVAGYSHDIAQILGTFLDNALRHTPSHGTVVVTARRGGAGASIEVTDEGPGLPNGEVNKVFGRFYRVTGDATAGTADAASAAAEAHVSPG